MVLVVTAMILGTEAATIGLLLVRPRPSGGALPAGLGPPGANSENLHPYRPEAIPGKGLERVPFDRARRRGHFSVLGTSIRALVQEIWRPGDKRRYSGGTGPQGVDTDALEGAEYGGTSGVAVRASVVEIWLGQDFGFFGQHWYVPVTLAVRRPP